MNAFLYSRFIFSKQYRVWRHLAYWVFHIAVWAAFWSVTGVPGSYARHLLNMTMWVPKFILFSYPLVYIAIPHLLLKRRVVEFLLAITGWAALGLLIESAYRTYLFIPAQEAMGLPYILPRGPLPFCYLCMTTSAAGPMIIKFFKLWLVKQQQWMQEQQQQAMAELKLLKAQIHPHLIFNTLDSIYTFSLEASSRTPQLILQLSSLLSYILYDCKSEEVSLDKELAAMKNYLDLEKEKCGGRIDISWSVDGDVAKEVVAPLLLLPFLENAVKHGVSPAIEKPWASVDIAVRNNRLYCKIVNSKDELALQKATGPDIRNVTRRLEVLYPGNYELRTVDEGNFYVVSLQVQLVAVNSVATGTVSLPRKERAFVPAG